MDLLAKMDQKLYLIPGMKYAVTSLIASRLPPLIASRVHATMAAQEAKCEMWAKTKDDTHDAATGKRKSGFMKGSGTATNIINAEPGTMGPLACPSANPNPRMHDPGTYFPVLAPVTRGGRPPGPGGRRES